MNLGDYVIWYEAIEGRWLDQPWWCVRRWGRITSIHEGRFTVRCGSRIQEISAHDVKASAPTMAALDFKLDKLRETSPYERIIQNQFKRRYG